MSEAENLANFEKYTQQVNIAAHASARSISQSIMDALTAYNKTMAAQHPASAPKGKVLRGGEWVWIKELSEDERANHWRSYSDDELHDTADSILDEINAREKKRHERSR